MIKNHAIHTYVHQNILIHPEADAKHFVQCLIVQSKKRNGSVIKIRLHDYIKDTAFCDVFVNKVQQLLKHCQTHRELANCKRLKMYGTYPEEGAVLSWSPQASA